MTVNYYFQFLIRKYGVLTLTGFALLLGALLWFFFLTVPELKKLGHSKEETENHKADNVTYESKTDPILSEADRLYKLMPAYTDMGSSLRQIFEAAAENDLVVEQVEYKLEAYDKVRFNRYHILMPMSGGYINIRKFINLAMQTNPSLSLDHVSFNRETAADTFVDVNLDFSLYLRADQK